MSETAWSTATSTPLRHHGEATCHVVSSAHEAGLSQALGPPLAAMYTSALMCRRNRPGAFFASNDRPSAVCPVRAQKVASCANSAEPSLASLRTRKFACRRYWPGKLRDSNEEQLASARPGRSQNVASSLVRSSLPALTGDVTPSRRCGAGTDRCSRPWLHRARPAYRSAA